ncbi:Aminopeptidase N [Acromyrmex echinatior]|uniref:Aminopeptidase N n=1 Tax=Acromyrmex echinatior TaxID=103372 RepID=F4X0B4_ACREC|nr:Aminopeptidase N [Acromyrmex echinatior]
MDHVAIPNFLQDDTSKWGLIFHTEADLMYDEKLDPVMRKMEVARLIASKIVYQWFNNILSSSWSHLWIYDAFANIFGEEAVAKSFNNSEILDLFIIQNQYHLESLHLDSHFNMNPVEITSPSEINSTFSFPRYMKAIIILRMFQSAITDEVFRNNIHTYVSRQMSSSLMPHNFSFMKEKLEDETYHCNISWNEILIWIQNKHYPVVSCERDTHSTEFFLSLSYNTTNYINWLIPINLREISLNENFKTCLAPHINNIRLIFPQSDCWMVNIEQAGKYLEKPLKTLGYEEQLMENDFTKCLRQEIVKWACTLQYDECERSALRKLEHHLENHESRPLLSWWKHWTYCNGLRIANSSIWSDVTDFLKKYGRKLLSFLTCSEYGTFTSVSFLELFTEDERQDITIIRLHIDIFHSIIMKHSNAYDVLEKILISLELRRPTQVNILTALVDIINHVYSYKNLKKVHDYITGNRYLNESQILKIVKLESMKTNILVTMTIATWNWHT